MKYSPIDPRKLTFPPADERPSDLDNINHMEFCHRLGASLASRLDIIII